MDVVNGYICRNCTDIDYAKRNVDPQHPKDGPYGVNKTNGVERGPAVVLGGALSGERGPTAPDGANGVAALSGVSAGPQDKDGFGRPYAQAAGGRLDISA